MHRRRHKISTVGQEMPAVFAELSHHCSFGPYWPHPRVLSASFGNILEKESFCKSYKRGLYASKEGVKENSLNALVQKLTNSIP